MSASDSFLPAAWRPRLLIAIHVFCLLLLLSWLWQPTRDLWNQLDVWIFKLLNDPVHAGGWWAYTWAIGSMRITDVVAGVVMLLVTIKSGLVFTGPQVRRALFGFLGLLVLLLLIRVVFDRIVDIMDWQRSSASLMVEGSARLSEMFPHWEETWELKDRSSRSFPGDHASVLLTWALFMSAFARGWRLGLVWFVAILFMLPRLVAGAHWATDALVGSVLLTLLACGWAFWCTPLTRYVSDGLERLTLPLTSRLAKWPLLGRFSIISGK